MTRRESRARAMVAELLYLRQKALEIGADELAYMIDVARMEAEACAGAEPIPDNPMLIGWSIGLRLALVNGTMPPAELARAIEPGQASTSAVHV